MIERSFVMMKPDAVSRRLMGQVLSRFEAKGLKIVAMKLRQIDEDLAKEHYGEHSEKPFFNGFSHFCNQGNKSIYWLKKITLESKCSRVVLFTLVSSL